MVNKSQKVNFLIIGAARSATTSLSNILSKHPEVCFSQPKEPQFFSDPEWKTKLDNYNLLFKNEAKLYGEGSTNYSKFPSFNKNIHDDIFEYNPDIKLIYIMRHPIDRIISHYKFACERGYAEHDIDKDVLLNPIYIDSSKYYSQITPYLERFKHSNIKLIFFEDYIKDPKRILEDVFKFLDISSFNFSLKLAHSNRSQAGLINHKKYDNPKTLIEKLTKVVYILKKKLFKADASKKHVLSEHTRKKLLLKLKEDTNNLEKLLEKDLTHWMK